MVNEKWIMYSPGGEELPLGLSQMPRSRRRRPRVFCHFGVFYILRSDCRFNLLDSTGNDVLDLVSMIGPCRHCHCPLAALRRSTGMRM